MGVEGLDWQPVHVPLIAGLDNKTHRFALDPPGLTACKNGEYDERGAIRTRKPYALLGNSIYPSGSLANVRKSFTVGDELLTFTDTGLYSWSPALSKHVFKGEHLAVAVTEQTRFANPNDQVFADRAQLGGVVVTVWVEVLPGGAVHCFLGASDATSKATVLAPVDFGAGPVRPRVVATDTRILVFWMEGTGLHAKAIDPAAPAFTASGSTLVSAQDGIYDVVRDPAADRAVAVVRDAPGTQYDIARVTAGLGVTVSNKARAAEGPIAVSVSPDGYAWVARVITITGVHHIFGDSIVVSTLGDNFWDQAIGTAATGAINHLAIAHRSTQNANQYRAYVWWSVDESTGIGTSPDFELRYNWIDTGATTGTEAVFLPRQGLASRAFEYGGHVYVWSVFASESLATNGTLESIQAPYQNTYFLHRDDGTLISKAVWQRAGGLGYYAGVQIYGHLPGVALVSGSTGFAWAGVERQAITTLQKIGRTYGARAPRDITFTFDSDDARRVVQLGATAYITGGMVMQYDGEALTEVGFQLYPWTLGLVTGGGTPAIPAGTYSYRASWRWQNARGDVERSTTATEVKVTLTGTDRVTADVTSLHITRKQGTIRNPAVEVWRTEVNPPNGAPRYLVTSKDPAITGVDNDYHQNDPTGAAVSVSDNFTDAILLTKEEHPENPGDLPRMAPPGATIIAASDDRLFLAGIPGEPTRVWYSLLRDEGEVAAFVPLLSFDLPAATGAITGLALWEETLLVFTATAVYAIPGDGFGNVTGTGTNYGPPRRLAGDVGALSHDTIAVTPGGVVFFSRKGWYRIGAGWQLEYIGEPVEAYNGDTWVAAQVLESQHQVRFLSTSRMLMWDYSIPPAGQWNEWTQTGGRGLALWRGTPLLVDTVVKAQQVGALDYEFEIELPLHLAGLQGMVAIRRIMFLGEFKADHQQRIRIARDYAASYFDDRSMTFTGLAAGDPTQFQHTPSQSRAQHYRVRWTIRDTNGNTPAYDAVTLVGVSFEAGFKRGLYQGLAATRKQ